MPKLLIILDNRDKNTVLAALHSLLSGLKNCPVAKEL